MITFLDGPAKGESLALRRIPKLLRVVRSRRGQWDALDQLDDVPQPGETIFVYVRRDEPAPTWYHVCARGQGRSASGRYWNAEYSLFRGEEPADHVLRDTDAWRAWAAQQAAGPLTLNP